MGMTGLTVLLLTQVDGRVDSACDCAWWCAGSLPSVPARTEMYASIYRSICWHSPTRRSIDKDIKLGHPYSVQYPSFRAGSGLLVYIRLQCWLALRGYMERRSQSEAVFSPLWVDESSPSCGSTSHGSRTGPWRPL